MEKLDKESADHLEFMETIARRIRSGSYQFLYQADPCILTKAIGEALGKFQAALQEYRSSKQNGKVDKKRSSRNKRKASGFIS